MWRFRSKGGGQAECSSKAERKGRNIIIPTYIYNTYKVKTWAVMESRWFYIEQPGRYGPHPPTKSSKNQRRAELPCPFPNLSKDLFPRSRKPRQMVEEASNGHFREKEKSEEKNNASFDISCSTNLAIIALFWQKCFKMWHEDRFHLSQTGPPNIGIKFPFDPR